MSSKSKSPSFLSRFDSATDMAKALGSALEGKTYRSRRLSSVGRIYARAVNNLPDSWKQELYTFGGITDAASHRKIEKINADDICKWIYHLYPRQKYPAIAIGSCNGALNHLYTALGIPWLPQTFLVPIHKGEKHAVDQPLKTIEWSKKPGEIFLRNNPTWRLTQMMDPVQDRLRVGRIAYFRIKLKNLSDWYLRFISENLQENGILLISECKLSWPVIRIADDHTFQFGGLGDLAPEEYYYGSDRTDFFLKEEKSSEKKWEIPPPDTVAPEAEWGFEDSLMADIRKLAKSSGYKISLASCEHPQNASAGIANLYRKWYKETNRSDKRLLIESFTIQSPLQALQTSSIPYWLFFNVDTAASMLENYLNTAGKFDEIFMMILSHGKKNAGEADIEKWESLLKKARKGGRFIGTDRKKYPLDLGIYARYAYDLAKALPEDNTEKKLSLEDFFDNYVDLLNYDGMEFSKPS